jgi:alpha 1,2-mannosyltransferase
MVGGSEKKYRTAYWVAIHAVRRTGSTLPIELWFPWGEQPDCTRIKELTNLGVQIQTFDDLVPRKSNKSLSGYAFKLLALVFSSFEEVLMIDADNVVLSSPEYLFDIPDYREKGALLWKDFWLESRAPEISEIGGLGLPGHWTHESGQVMVNKSKIWPALMLACYMNHHWPLFYPLINNYMGFGDKELLPVALTYVGLSYGIISKGPDHIGVRTDRAAVYGNTMMQHDDRGEPIFLHANAGKWTTHVPDSFHDYIRRWQSSLIHGNNIKLIIEKRSGIDLELWIHSLLVKHRCLFDPRPPTLWFEKLDRGPLLEGMFLTDHYNMNKDLTVFQQLIELGYILN